MSASAALLAAYPAIATVHAITGTVALATPATAAPDGPNEHASCIGRTFVPQATGGQRRPSVILPALNPFSL